MVRVVQPTPRPSAAEDRRSWHPAAVIEVLLIHSALGLRPAVRADARRIRALGHRVTAPDLFDGEQFSDPGEAVRHLDRVGRSVVRSRAEDIAAQMAPGVVYAGYSMGAGVAHWLLELDGQAGGAILLSNANAPTGARYRCPVQVHVSQQDPWVDRSHLRLMTNAGADVHTYRGGHLFTDPDLPDYDARSDALVWQRVATFLSQLP